MKPPFFLFLVILGGCASGDIVADSGHRSTDPGTPVILASSPAGLLSSGTQTVVLEVETDRSSNCRFSSSTGVDFDSMTEIFQSGNGMVHSQSIGTVTDGSSYSYFARCRSTTGETNQADYPIMFGVSSTGKFLLKLDFDHDRGSPTHVGYIGFPLFQSMYNESRGYGYDLGEDPINPGYTDRVGSRDRHGNASGTDYELDFHRRDHNTLVSAPFKIRVPRAGSYQIKVYRGDRQFNNTFDTPMDVRAEGIFLGRVGISGTTTQIHNATFTQSVVDGFLNLEFAMTLCTPSSDTDPFCNWGVNALEITEL